MNKTLAVFLSWVGHPLLILTYILLLMLAVNPFAFGVRSIDDRQAIVLAISVFSTTVLIPGFGVALMKPLGLIRSLEMKDKQERIGPYIITGVFYLWLFKNLMSTGRVPGLFSAFVLGATISLFLAFFINIFTKISAHATGMGGLLAMALLMAFEWRGLTPGIPAFGGFLQVSMVWVLSIVALLAGAVGAARLALGAHTPDDLYRGYAAGFGSVMLAGALV
jgi:membrane-associated phospholipid phosphatase